jgi:hypothetical protein
LVKEFFLKPTFDADGNVEEVNSADDEVKQPELSKVQKTEEG